MNRQECLADLRPGQSAAILRLENADPLRRRLLDMGLTANTPVECIGRSPLGDPSAYLVRGAVIAIRAEDGRNIIIRR